MLNPTTDRAAWTPPPPRIRGCRPCEAAGPRNTVLNLVHMATVDEFAAALVGMCEMHQNEIGRLLGVRTP